MKKNDQTREKYWQDVEFYLTLEISKAQTQKNEVLENYFKLKELLDEKDLLIQERDRELEKIKQISFGEHSELEQLNNKIKNLKEKNREKRKKIKELETLKQIHEEELESLRSKYKNKKNIVKKQDLD